MTYATVAELEAVSGSYYDSVTLQGLLDDAERKIRGKLTVAGVSAPASDDGLKSACLCLARAEIVGMVRTDGSIRDVKDEAVGYINVAVKDLKDEAAEYINDYVLASQTQRYRWSIRKVNA